MDLLRVLATRRAELSEGMIPKKGFIAPWARLDISAPLDIEQQHEGHSDQ